MRDGDDNCNNKKWRVQCGKNQPCRWNAFEPGIDMSSNDESCGVKVAMLVGKSLFAHDRLTKKHLVCCNNSTSDMNDES